MPSVAVDFRTPPVCQLTISGCTSVSLYCEPDTLQPPLAGPSPAVHGAPRPRNSPGRSRRGYLPEDGLIMTRMTESDTLPAFRALKPGTLVSKSIAVTDRIFSIIASSGRPSDTMSITSSICHPLAELLAYAAAANEQEADKPLCNALPTHVVVPFPCNIYRYRGGSQAARSAATSPVPSHGCSPLPWFPGQSANAGGAPLALVSEFLDVLRAAQRYAPVSPTFERYIPRKITGNFPTRVCVQLGGNSSPTRLAVGGIIVSPAGFPRGAQYASVNC